MKEILSKASDKLKITVVISDDGMKVFLSAECLASGYIARTDIEALLGNLLPSDLVHSDVLHDCAIHLSKGEKIEQRRIAKGVEPQEGLAARLVFLVKRYVDPTKKKDPNSQEEAGPSLRDLNLFDNIRVGTIVARFYPAKAGTDGRDALGKAVKAPASQALTLKLDQSLELKPEAAGEGYQAIVAKTSGYLLDDAGALSIKDELLVRGNVDFHVGNLDFVGSITVKGDLLTGFTVRADKTISIQGSVQGGVAHSRTADVLVKQFVFGGDHGSIVCGGSFSCATARKASVEAIGNILIGKEAIGCSFRTQAAVIGEKAKIIGGSIHSVCGVDALQLGNDSEIPTIIELCSDIEMTTEYTTLSVGIASHRKAAHLLELHLGPYAKNASRVEVLKGPFRARIEALLRKKREVDRSLLELLTKQTKLLETSRVAQVVRLNVRKMLYPGVIVRVGKEEFAPTEAIKGPCSIEFNAVENKFITGDLQALQCVLVSKKDTADQSATGQSPPAASPDGSKAATDKDKGER